LGSYANPNRVARVSISDTLAQQSQSENAEA